MRRSELAPPPPSQREYQSRQRSTRRERGLLLPPPTGRQVLRRRGPLDAAAPSVEQTARRDRRGSHGFRSHGTRADEALRWPRRRARHAKANAARIRGGPPRREVAEVSVIHERSRARGLRRRQCPTARLVGASVRGPASTRPLAQRRAWLSTMTRQPLRAAPRGSRTWCRLLLRSRSSTGYMTSMTRA